MQELERTLEEIRSLHERVFGGPAPEPNPPAFLPMPVGVDPIEHALAEFRCVKQIAERMERAPRSGAWVPLADSFASSGEFVVRVEIPGVSREDLKVHVVGRECIVQGERKPPHCTGEMRPMLVERPWGSFERRFVLPTGSRVDEMKARYVNGLLEITIPVNPVELPEEQNIEIA